MLSSTLQADDSAAFPSRTDSTYTPTDVNEPTQKRARVTESGDFGPNNGKAKPGCEICGPERHDLSNVARLVRQGVDVAKAETGAFTPPHIRRALAHRAGEQVAVVEQAHRYQPFVPVDRRDIRSKV
ncbi:hypothetical protein ACWC1D_28340 [Streptomyces sp. NPDC001478]